MPRTRCHSALGLPIDISQREINKIYTNASRGQYVISRNMRRECVGIKYQVTYEVFVYYPLIYTGHE